MLLRWRSAPPVKARIVGCTAAGFPLYAVFYGTFDDQPRQSNWSAAGSSGSHASYYGEPEKQTIVWATGWSSRTIATMRRATMCGLWIGAISRGWIGC